jgi:hypothetical protein
MTCFDELFPAVETLLGFQFETAENLQRAAALCWGRGLGHREVSRNRNMIVGLKSSADAYRAMFRDAGLTFTEIELFDVNELPPEEAAAIMRENIREGMKVLLEQMRRKQ